MEFIQQTTEAGDFVVSDDLMLLFRAGRLVPPPFGDVSVVAIRSGFQTDERLIELTAAYDCPLVVVWRERFAWLPVLDGDGNDRVFLGEITFEPH